MLVPMRNLLDKATIEGYGVVAPNVINECTARVCIEAAEELHAPLILDVGYVFHPDLVFLGRMLEEIAVRSSVLPLIWIMVQPMNRSCGHCVPDLHLL